MSDVYTYNCPHCLNSATVDETLVGQNVVCPSCSQEFFATPPEQPPAMLVPEKLPFFKSGRKKLLDAKLKELVADGELSVEDDQTLEKVAILLDLDKSDMTEIVKQAFFAEFASIQKRMERSWVMTDQDCIDIENLKRKYGVKNLDMQGTASLFRRIYLLEERGELPNPVVPDVMLDANETAYFGVHSTWQQIRVQRHGYAGTSFSIPTGIKGVKFRFGEYTPIRSEELTALASGALWVTSKRLLFHGDKRNTKIDHKKIVNIQIFIDAIKVEKLTGKPDYFSMGAADARFISALIGRFRNG